MRTILAAQSYATGSVAREVWEGADITGNGVPLGTESITASGEEDVVGRLNAGAGLRAEPGGKAEE
jgi:hypothetical protein